MPNVAGARGKPHSEETKRKLREQGKAAWAAYLEKQAKENGPPRPESAQALVESTESSPKNGS